MELRIPFDGIATSELSTSKCVQLQTTTLPYTTISCQPLRESRNEHFTKHLESAAIFRPKHRRDGRDLALSWGSHCWPWVAHL